MSPITKRINKRSKVMCIDPSASHLAYAIAMIEPEGKYELLEAGIIWTKDSWTNGHKFTYMFSCLKKLITESGIDICFTEAFFTSPKMRMGTHVIPTINNFMQMIIYQSKLDIAYEEISPSAWRKPLGIKPVLNGSKKDYKTPTKAKVEEMLGKLPNELISNITGNMRSLPTDVPDAIAISLYVALDHHTKTFAGCDISCYNNYSKAIYEENIND